MINSSDKISELLNQFNDLEKRVKSLEEKVAELEITNQRVEEIIKK